MNRNRFLYLLIPLLTLCMTACAPSLVITTSGGNAADISFESGLSPFGGALTRRLTGSGDTTAPLYEHSAAVSSLEKAGLTVRSLSFPGGNDIDFSGSVADLTGSLITAAPSGEEITVTLSPDTLREVMDMLPPETGDLAELLMAPVFTGEDLQPDEYLEILSAAYGERASSEISSSRCTLYIKAPKPVQDVRCSGTCRNLITTGYSDNTATITIPLVFLLTLSDTITLTARW